MMKTKKKLTRARIRLLNKYPFFGRLCMLLDFEENPQIPTMGTDGHKLYYRQEFVDSLDEQTLITILAHEVLHNALGHIWRKGKRKRFRWNVATDYAVNLVLESNGFEPIKGALLDSRFQGKNAETIYSELEDQEELQFYGGGFSGFKSRPNKPTDNCPTKRHKLWGTKKKEGSRAKEQAKKNLNKKAQGQREKLTEKDVKRLQKKWGAALSETFKKCKERGELPAGMERLIENVESKENWKEILANYLSHSFTDFNFMKRDRRTLGSPFYLPDLEDQDSLENFVVAIDTSGSIGNNELNRFLAEIKEIVNSFPNIKGWIIECDAEVGRVMEIDKVDEINNFTGGGGTSHRPVFHEIKKRELDPKVVVCFTDMYTEFPDHKPDYPVLWLVTPDGDMSSPPFGRNIKMTDLERGGW